MDIASSDGGDREMRYASTQEGREADSKFELAKGWSATGINLVPADGYEVDGRLPTGLLRLAASSVSFLMVAFCQRVHTEATSSPCPR